MQNIEKFKVDEVRNNCEQFYSLLNETDKWVLQNLKFEEGETLSVRIKDSRRVVRKLRRSLDSKPVFALFGASQVGKSYLVKNLLSVDGKPLEIQMDQECYDFLKEINPPGVGAESTGVVTRFSIDQSAPIEGFPVRVKLLDVKDIVIILCDGFFSDVKKITNYPGPDSFKQLLEDLEEKYKNSQHLQQVLTEDDILDIRDYFTRHFYKSQHIIDQIEASRYWTRFCMVVSKMPTAAWVEAFSILWANQVSISTLFMQMINELEKMKFSHIIYTVKGSVLRGQGEILDVQRLKEMRANKKSIKVAFVDGNTEDVNLCTLSAVSSELTLGISESVGKSKGFLKNTDLLDFPGARSRLELNLDSVTDESVPDMFLRGKVAYLFNKYSADYEINNLLFCQNDKQLDVNEIPSILHNWIANNIGRNADEREKSSSRLSVPPLFVIFTFFNNQLKYDTTNDDKENIDYKWNNRFVRFFEQEVVTTSYNWYVDWMEKDPIFKNFYLLRDFKYSDDTFYGFEESGIEQAVRPDRVMFMEKLKLSFLNFPFIQKHLSSPLEAWEESASPNADGSNRIIRNLEPAANNYVKMHNYIVQLTNHRNTVVSRLSKYYYSDNLQEKRITSLKRSNELQLELNKVFGKNPMLFSLFIDRIMLSESSVYNYFHENLSTSRSVESFDEYTLFKSQYPMLNAAFSKEKNIALLRDQLFLSSDAEVEHFLDDSGIDLNKLFGNKESTSGSSLVSGLFVKWKSAIQYDNFSELIAAGLSRNTFDFLIDTLITTIDHLNLQEFLVTHVEKKTQRLQMGRDSEEFLASLCTHYINDFLVNVGFNYMSQERLDELVSIAHSYNINVQLLFDEQEFLDKAAIKDFFNAERTTEHTAIADFAYMIASYNKFLLKVKLAILSNCGFVSYDIQANNQLSQLLDKMGALNFNLE
ncbi:MAG: ABC transporter ATP-binding protein [Bacteroidetes bacterium]|nr:ABC transporter ATP-binding protein [Bacteroidota bacterium]